MKNLILIALLLAFLGNKTHAQKKWHSSVGGEMIFSFANIDYNGVSGSNIVRWTPWFNVQFYESYDFNNHFGFIMGITIRNVGFIYDNAPNLTNIGSDEYENDIIKYKFRNYDFGLPIGFKVGVLDKIFLFAGYEFEFPFWFKQKTFINGVKQDDHISTWFTSRTPVLYDSFFAGIQFPYGLSVKFKYYITNFFNEDYTEIQNGVSVQPYKGLNAKMWYFSLCYNIFTKGKIGH